MGMCAFLSLHLKIRHHKKVKVVVRHVYCVALIPFYWSADTFKSFMQ